MGNLSGFVLPLEGDVNWKEVISALREINYNDYLIAEFFPYRYKQEVLLEHLSSSLDAILSL